LATRLSTRVAGHLLLRAAAQRGTALDRLLTKAEAAEALAVSVRFIERCVLERRIRYVKLGKFVRIPESGVADFFEAGEVPARW